MLKRILIAALWLPLMALAQSYPSPTFNNLTVQGVFTATGKVGLPSLASQAANTVVANTTGSSASPTAFAMPSCSTANSALQYTNGTGFTCIANNAITTGTLAQFASTTSAQLASIVPDETGSGSLVFGTNPAVSGLTGSGVTQLSNTSAGASVLKLTGNGATTPSKYLGVLSGVFNIQNNAQNSNILSLTDLGALAVTGSITPSTTGGIVGTTLADNANAGSSGEYNTAVGSAVSLTSGTPANITSVTLAAGDYDVWGNIEFDAAGSTIIQGVTASISNTSATHSASPDRSILTGITFTAGSAVSLITPSTRINASTSTTIYLVGTATFTTSTLTATGRIAWRRRR